MIIEKIKGFIKELPDSISASLRHNDSIIYLSEDIIDELVYDRRFSDRLFHQFLEGNNIFFQGVQIKETEGKGIIYTFGNDYHYYLKLDDNDIIRLEPHKFNLFMSTYKACVVSNLPI